MQMSFWTSPERFFTSWKGSWDPFCRPRASLGAALGSQASPQSGPNWGPGGQKQKKSQGSFLPSELQSPSGPILEPFYVDFYDLLTFYQAKVQFPIKNIPFTCITAMSDACYAGKKTILKKKHHFYLHNRHLRSTQGGCYAGKSECGKGKNSLLPA